MMNQILQYNNRLVSPFVPLHGMFTECCSWLSLLSVCYFRTKKDWETSRSHSQVHTMDGIIIGRKSNSNATIVYNHHNKKCCYPKSRSIDPHRQLGSIYPNIKYNIRMF